MGRLAESDLRGIFGFLASTVAGTPEDPLPQRSLVALRDLIGADEAEYFELRRSDRATLAASQSDEITDAAGSDEALARYGHQNPLNWRRWHPAHGALRLSGLIGRRDLRRLGFYADFMRPNGLRDTLKVWLSSSEESAACVQLWRHDGEFTRREQDLLAVLHQPLIDLRARSRLRRRDSWGAATLTVREAEILVWAARGASDQAIGARFRLSPATVGKHLENAYAALGVHSRAEAIARFTLAPPDGPQSA